LLMHPSMKAIRLASGERTVLRNCVRPFFYPSVGGCLAQVGSFRGGEDCPIYERA
jgi:hypothetical protein